MPVRVVDASAVAALLFGEPTAEAIARECDGCTLAAPTLWRYEVGNACLQKLRRHPDRREALLAAFALADRLDIQDVEVNAHETVLLAAELDLAVYDAAYVWLARSLGAELVTLDTELRRAVRRQRRGGLPPGQK